MRIENAKTRYPKDINKVDSEQQRVSVYSESYKGEYYNIDITKLIPYKNQVRKFFEEKALQSLGQTIKLYGIRQPLTIIPSSEKEGKYEIISGERRWRAAQLVGLRKVPCIILYDKKIAEEVALIENVQRKNLHPLELMNGLQNLLERGICKNHQEIADKIGVTRTKIGEILSLKDLPEKTKTLLLEKKIIARAILRQLLKLKPEEQERYIKSQIKENDNKKKTTKRINNKTKLFSIYLESGDIIFKQENNIILNKEQKKVIESFFKIENERTN